MTPSIRGLAVLLLFLLNLARAAGPEAILTEALDEAMAVLSEQEDPPHYIALALLDLEEIQIVGRLGTLDRSEHQLSRHLDVDLRVGTPELDTTRPLRGFSSFNSEDRRMLTVPLDRGYGLRHALWKEIDARYRDARERMVLLRANQQVKVEEERQAPDFSPRERGEVAQIEVAPLEVDVPGWEARVARLSAQVEAYPEVHFSQVQVHLQREIKTFVDTEGARLSHGRPEARVALMVQTTAEDGDQVQVYAARHVHDPARLPDEATLSRWADEAVERLLALRDAPRAGPYTGPVLLDGRAAAVFFHEVLGHRVESQRQKRESEGRTFADHIGRPILPSFIDVYDDPRIAHLHGEDLNGHYLYDDEGIPAQRAELVESGIFKGFLTSRSPILEDPSSNGHGRRSPGNAPVSRMGNTIIETSKPTPRAAMREQLLAEARRQGLDYAYIVADIDGGFTMTGRVTPNAFNVRANTTWRVYTDGRPDELVRGIDLVGTPFAAFSNLIATGDDPEVFNGRCGAESGWVPVSGVSPSLLFSRLEFQIKEKGQERPPLLEKPIPPTGTAHRAPDPGPTRLAGGAR